MTAALGNIHLYHVHRSQRAHPQELHIIMLNAYVCVYQICGTATKCMLSYQCPSRSHAHVSDVTGQRRVLVLVLVSARPFIDYTC